MPLAKLSRSWSAMLRGSFVLAQLLLLPVAGAQAPAPAPAPAPVPAPKAIGAIVDFKDGHLGDGTMSVEYSYGADSRLILVIRGVEMNGAAHSNPGKSVGGELAVRGNQIQIAPEEIYGAGGPVETTRIYTLRYIVPNVAPGIYRLLHDDSKAEGGDQIIDIKLDLRKPVKKTLVVKGKLVPVVPVVPAAPAPAPVIPGEILIPGEI